MQAPGDGPSTPQGLVIGEEEKRRDGARHTVSRQEQTDLTRGSDPVRLFTRAPKTLPHRKEGRGRGNGHQGGGRQGQGAPHAPPPPHAHPFCTLDPSNDADRPALNQCTVQPTPEPCTLLDRQ